MSDIYPPTVQRPPLSNLLKALGAREAALRRDECGDWRINGTEGGIFAVPGSLDRPKTEGFQIYVECDTVRQWSSVKAAMSPFTDLTNDGDSEGMFFLDHLPTREEARTIRRYVGVRKRREDSEEALAAARERTGKYRFQPKRTGSGEI